MAENVETITIVTTVWGSIILLVFPYLLDCLWTLFESLNLFIFAPLVQLNFLQFARSILINIASFCASV